MEEERTSIAEWGIYVAGVASVLIWLLKFVGDLTKKSHKGSGDQDGESMYGTCNAIFRAFS
jgi:hypothetical protein